jgi:type IV secretory pathway VirB2 component (pilin)
MRRYLAIVLVLAGLLFLLSCDEDPPGYTGPWQEVLSSVIEMVSQLEEI